MIIYCIVYYFQNPKSTVDQVIIGMAFILVLIKIFFFLKEFLLVLFYSFFQGYINAGNSATIAIQLYRVSI